MTARTVLFFQALSASLTIAGGLLLSGSSVPPTSREASLHQAFRLADIDPKIFHHWPNVHATTTVADVDPAIFHHWPHAATTVADADPKIFHHWPNVDATVTVADIDSSIFHHWG
ncbi:hypothetical protein HN018_24910 (plasmid) [Lichenicola cladoniae]|uniref:Uncharacterized protein n=1 Tax=Lichenicola cladoniae TaxID=1484109 RepID=A0A6M8HYX9_9PROT|nr:hypothetical protein [Lichenicola cladoniae]NPD68207.1 hypothetical protein [Acetobacteraceae bacterium]QKE93427.1 hypothetical protein HN018_24910 [Lichenicola cladoniae]